MKVDQAAHTYVFIDGAYLRRVYSGEMQKVFGVDGKLSISPIIREAEASRVYFYDAIDYTRGPNETDEAWEKRVMASEHFFFGIRALSGYHVRPGSVRRGKGREQKEVDVLLAVDMLTYGFRGGMNKAVLISGDVDFRPAVRVLVEHGIFVDVWYHSSSFSQELPHAADCGRSLSFRTLYSWSSPEFTEKHPLPSDSFLNAEPAGVPINSGLCSGVRAELRLSDHAGIQLFNVWIEAAPNMWRRISNPNRELIDRYLAAEYGNAVEWDQSDG